MACGLCGFQKISIPVLWFRTDADDSANLKSLFDEVSKIVRILGKRGYTNGAPAETDVVVYVFYSKNDSIITEKSGDPIHDSASGGTFPHTDGMISEIYLEPLDGAAEFARLTANLIFHEIMHNKLDASMPRLVPDIHTGGGGGLAAAKVSYNSTLTPENITKMAQGLPRKIKQFTAKMKDPSS